MDEFYSLVSKFTLSLRITNGNPIFRVFHINVNWSLIIENFEFLI
jgi:hypothetical protein